MATKPKKNDTDTARPDLDNIIATHLGRLNSIPLPAAALEDIRYFAAAAQKGKPITRAGLLKYLSERYELHLGPKRLARACIEAGVKPWFCAS